MNLHSIFFKIRHNRYLKKYDFIWDILRKPYGFFIDPLNKGIPLVFNDDTTIRLPLRFYSKNIVNYEQKPTKFLTSWIKSNPESLVIDLGAAIGYISSIALHSSNKVKVIGIDSDLMSLKISEWICSYAEGNRYQVVQSFISDRSNEICDLNHAVNLTYSKLKEIKLKKAIVSNEYQVLGDATKNDIPIYTIDNLFNNANISTPVLIKCDIEGAEILAIKGAIKFIYKYNPHLAISVHPTLLANYNSSSEELKQLIINLGYTVELISIDHEEHWWCTPLN